VHFVHGKNKTLGFKKSDAGTPKNEIEGLEIKAGGSSGGLGLETLIKVSLVFYP
jgi:hypothetical protein